MDKRVIVKVVGEASRTLDAHHKGLLSDREKAQLMQKHNYKLRAAQWKRSVGK